MIGGLIGGVIESRRVRKGWLWYNSIGIVTVLVNNRDISMVCNKYFAGFQ